MTLLEQLKEKTLIKSLKFPRDMVFSLENDILNIKMTKKGIDSNMQDDPAAFESWAILMKFWLPVEIKKVQVQIPQIEPPLEKKNLNHFLYRLKKFVETYPWADAIFESTINLDDFSFDNLVLNIPNKKAKKNAQLPEAHLERMILDNQGGINVTDHQLPVGVFRESVSKKNQVMNNGFIDIWGIKEDILNIYELKKKGNDKVGIISELFFYVNIMNDLMNHRINYEKNVSPPNFRSFDIIYDAYRNCKINTIYGYFLTKTLHPLFYGCDACDNLEKSPILKKLLAFINDSDRLRKERIEFRYQYQELEEPNNL